MSNINEKKNVILLMKQWQTCKNNIGGAKLIVASVCCLLLVFLPTRLFPQSTFEGILLDSLTKEPIPFANIISTDGSTTSVLSREDGSFSITTSGSQLVVVAYGYNQKTIPVIQRKKGARPQKIVLVPYSFTLADVTVTAKRKKAKYTRKNNPAVELVKEVIAHKEQNNLEDKSSYKIDTYEKTTVSLNNFKFQFKRPRAAEKYSFIQNHLDTSAIDTTRIMVLALRERYGTEYFRQKPHSKLFHIEARNRKGVVHLFDKDGLSDNLDVLFQPINLYQNEIELLSNSFVSPLSSTLAISFYHYYLTDTVYIDGVKCANLAFSPVNPESMGFVGRMYIVLDGSYAVKGFEINTPQRINLNFLNRFLCEQQYVLANDSSWIPSESNAFATFYFLRKNKRQLYVHQHRAYEHYEPHLTNADSLFRKAGREIVDSSQRKSRNFWIEHRSQPLTYSETMLDSLEVELQRIPSIMRLIKTLEILSSNYIPTSANSKDSRFDFGPIINTVSFNSIEGVRLRVGGMSTANLHPHFFFKGYVAFGCKDLKPKYNVDLIYSFPKKKYHPFETPRRYLSLSSSYETEFPGCPYALLDKDNVLTSINAGEPLRQAQYVMRNTLMYEHDFSHHFTLTTHLQHEYNMVAGDLAYYRFVSDSNLLTIKRFQNLNALLQLRFAPGEKGHNSRLGHDNPFNLSRGTPVLTISHMIGYFFESDFSQGRIFNHTEISVEWRIKMAVFGYIDAALRGGIVWNKVPFPLLIFPNSNQSILMQADAFNTMKPMEFVADKYASLHLTYHLNGLILNRIPGIKRLRLREVVSVAIFESGLSRKNNPTINPEGLYLLPPNCSVMSKIPYVEVSVGIENIFKVLRVDYFFRCTYLKQPDIRKGGVRFSLKFTL